MFVLKNLSMTSGVVLVVFALTLVSAQNDLELSPQNEYEPIEEIQELLQQVQAIFEQQIAPKVQQGAVPDSTEEDEQEVNSVGETGAPHATTGCKCSRLTCTCCKVVCVPSIGLRQNYCLSLTYQPWSKTLQVTLKAGWQTIFSKQVSVLKPQKICVPVTCSKSGITLCLQFYAMSIRGGFVCGCSKVVVRCPSTILKTVVLGCFRVHCLDAVKQLEEQQSMMEVPEEPIYFGEVQMEKLSPAAGGGGMM